MAGWRGGDGSVGRGGAAVRGVLGLVCMPACEHHCLRF